MHKNFYMTQKTLDRFLAWKEENADYLKGRPSKKWIQKKLLKEGIDVSLGDLKRLRVYTSEERLPTDHYATQIAKQASRIGLDVTTAKNVWVKSKADDEGISASFLCKNPLFNEQGFDFEKFKQDLLNEINELSDYKIPIQEATEGETLLVFSLPDLHIGKVPTSEIEEAVYSSVQNLFSRINFSSGKYRILFIVGNDLLNSDFEYKTTKGTQQFDVSEYYESFTDAIRVIRNVIDTLSSYAKIEIINIPGNHDRTRGFYLGEVISAYYLGIVDNTISPRKYYQFGKTLLGFDHGELKADEYPLLMATESPLLYAVTNHHDWFLGHLHGEKTQEIKGFKMRFLPSLTHHRDQWHNRNGYIGNKRCAMIYKYDYENGLIGTEVYNFA